MTPIETVQALMAYLNDHVADLRRCAAIFEEEGMAPSASESRKAADEISTLLAQMQAEPQVVEATTEPVAWFCNVNALNGGTPRYEQLAAKYAGSDGAIPLYAASTDERLLRFAKALTAIAHTTNHCGAEYTALSEVAEAVLREVLPEACEVEGVTCGITIQHEREQVAAMLSAAPVVQVVEQLRALIADDAWACTFQTFGQYRSALLKAIDRLAPQEPRE